jgi:oligopeptide transport system substrate-binding protein
VPNGISNYINTGNIESLNQSQLAKKYYNLAGYNINKPFNIKLLFHTNEANKTIAAAVASMWKKNLGINTELINQEWKVYLKAKLDKSQTEIIREGWIAPFDDPIGFLGIFVSDNPQNASGFNNAAYDNLIYKAEKESDISVRAKLLKQAEDILLEEAPIVPIYTPEAYHLVKPYIGGFNVDNRDRTYDKYIYIIPTQ